jgi:hypothetical protein
LTRKQSTAECGCKSASLTYRVTDRRKRQISVAEVWSLDRDDMKTPFTFMFVLEPDRTVKSPRPLHLSLGCTDPD